MTNSEPTRRARGRKFIKRPGELGKPIRPLVVRPKGFAIPDDPEAIKIANEEMEKLHAQAVTDAWLAKLKLLLRHYELADDDWFGLALNLDAAARTRSLDSHGILRYSALASMSSISASDKPK